MEQKRLRDCLERFMGISPSGDNDFSLSEFYEMLTGLLQHNVVDPNSIEFKNFIGEELKRIDPTKPAGTKMCDGVMHVWPTSAFEGIALRERGGNLEIYLRRRALDDTAYPGEWHAPGSLYRHGEQDRDVAKRLEGEFGTKIENFLLVGKEITKEARGTVHSMIFLIQLAGDTRIDDRHGWFPWRNLPEDMVMVDIHRDFIIPQAVAAYTRLSK